ncbi:MAG TPA: hypothetical protein VOB72_23750 [Candidatus Dormibacteraeota bacterium]|nr:hypothetical protein [Candidatus Dormibacteraeota bacterium]
MTESIGWLAVSLFCAVVGGALGAAVVHRRAQAGGDADRDAGN